MELVVNNKGTFSAQAFQLANNEVEYFTKENEDVVNRPNIFKLVTGLVGAGMMLLQIVEAVVLTVVSVFLIMADLIDKSEYKGLNEDDRRLTIKNDEFKANLLKLKAKLEDTWLQVFTIARLPVDAYAASLDE